MTDDELDEIILDAERALHALGSHGMIENAGNRPMDAYGLLTTVSSAAIVLRMEVESANTSLTRDQKYHVLVEVQSAVFEDQLLATAQKLTELLCMVGRQASLEQDGSHGVWDSLYQLLMAASGLSAAAMAAKTGGIPVTLGGEPRIYQTTELVQLSRNRADKAVRLIDKALAEN
jgi:hypothetical protein